MAGKIWTEADRLALYRELEEGPYAYGFFQALRRIECANPHKEKIGCAAKPADDAVRLGQEPSMAFAPSTLAEFDWSQEAVAPRLNVYFFGVFGPNGPLPLHLTEYARDRIRNSADGSLVRFIDIFHHRLLSLFYRAWADAQPTTHLDRPETDEFCNRIGSLFGIGSPEFRARDEIPDYAKLYFAGRFADQTKSAEGLLAVITEYLQLSANLEQYVGNWLDIPEQDQMRLGETPQTGSLGETSTLGEKVWECQNKFRLTLGPLRMADYISMLPGGTGLKKLVTLVRNYLGDEFDWDLQLRLQREEIRPVCLNHFGELGWTTWMVSDLPLDDFDNLYLDPIRDLNGCSIG